MRIKRYLYPDGSQEFSSPNVTVVKGNSAGPLNPRVEEVDLHEGEVYLLLHRAQTHELHRDENGVWRVRRKNASPQDK